MSEFGWEGGMSVWVVKVICVCLCGACGCICLCVGCICFLHVWLLFFSVCLSAHWIFRQSQDICQSSREGGVKQEKSKRNGKTETDRETYTVIDR